MKFFIDHNLSDKLAKGGRGFGEDVIHLTEQFPCDAKDVDWLKWVGENGIFLISRDERIRKNPAELDTFKRYKVGAFFVAGKGLKACDIIQMLVRHWPRIRELAAATYPPFAFRLPPNGTKIDKIPL